MRICDIFFFFFSLFVCFFLISLSILVSYTRPTTIDVFSVHGISDFDKCTHPPFLEYTDTKPPFSLLLLCQEKKKKLKKKQWTTNQPTNKRNLQG